MANENYESISTIKEIRELDKKIASLSENYPNDQKIEGLVSALQELRNAIEKDLAPKGAGVELAAVVEMDIEGLEEESASEKDKKIPQSSAMVILEATNEMLDKVLANLKNKEQAQPLDIAKALNDYHAKCKKATEWPLWQKLVLGVIGAVIGAVFAASFMTGTLAIPMVLTAVLLEKADNDPLYALHLIEKNLKQSLPESMTPKTTFFTPYDKLASDVKKTAADILKQPSQDDQNKSEDKSAPDKTNTLR